MVQRRHLPALDGLRGIAIIAVLLRHSAYIFQAHESLTRWFLPILEFGNWGVDLFFVLSGFLITGILFDTRTALNRASSFYGRRVLRIFPVYYVAIALVFFLEAHSLWARQALNLQVPADRFSYLFYFQNWLPLWHHGEYPESIISHFWSLAVEEQFYLVWPIVVWHISQRSVARLCGLALLLSLIVRTALVAHYGSGIWVYAFTITRSDGLWVGSGLAALYALHGQISSRTLRILGGLGLLSLGVIVVLRPINQLWLTGTYMSMVGITGVACLSGALLVLALRPRKTRLGGLLQMPWLRAYGKYSYGMYVWHFPLYYWIQHLAEERGFLFPLPAAAGGLYVCLLYAANFCAAWLSFHAYERWFLQLKKYWAPQFAQAEQEAGPRGWVSSIPTVAPDLHS